MPAAKGNQPYQTAVWRTRMDGSRQGELAAINLRSCQSSEWRIARNAVKAQSNRSIVAAWKEERKVTGHPLRNQRCFAQC